MLRAEALHEPGWYDLVHSHYWLSGQVGWLARERWGVPLVHTAHTLAKVKNAAAGRRATSPSRAARVIGEEQVVAEADRLIASTDDEAAPARRATTAPTRRTVRTVAAGRRPRPLPPGRPAAAARPPARACAADALLLLFVGRIQPLKAPDVLLRRGRAAARRRPRAARTGCRWSSSARPAARARPRPRQLQELAAELGIADLVALPARRQPPDRLADYYRAADVTVVPSHNESFGLVALESQACGTPVVAAAVGGLRDRGARRRLRRAGRRPRPRRTGPRCSPAARPAASCSACRRRGGTPRGSPGTAPPTSLLAAYVSAAEAQAARGRPTGGELVRGPLRAVNGAQVAW